MTAALAHRRFMAGKTAAAHHTAQATCRLGMAANGSEIRSMRGGCLAPMPPTLAQVSTKPNESGSSRGGNVGYRAKHSRPTAGASAVRRGRYRSGCHRINHTTTAAVTRKWARAQKLSNDRISHVDPRKIVW